MKNLIKLLHDESGVSAIEYGLIVALIVIGIIASIQSIGESFVVGPMSTVGSNLDQR